MWLLLVYLYNSRKTLVIVSLYKILFSLHVVSFSIVKISLVYFERHLMFLYWGFLCEKVVARLGICWIQTKI